jgi:hypothetical protein
LCRASLKTSVIEKANTSQVAEYSFSLSIVTAYSAELLTYLVEYWRGLLSAYGLEVTDTRIATGAVKVTFVSRGKLLKAEPLIIK